MQTFILLQASNGGGGAWGNLILFGGIAIIFYFFMLRPQQKKQKDQKNFLGSIKKGDVVVTVGGIHGKILTIEEDYVVLEVDKGAKIKFEKSSISLEASKKYAEKSKS
ncbi:preprotein translocase subunit YajC [Fulvivirgaceae bacterium BMA10]|uniref:Sec translocon accessory complex subunit YajC n=1 Tax=Splendidivirga corallicola TaxID=3051826 RepID=A0ABT8KJ17_9BACT|nr:preprotein translocase subunit YajC [Fulvivirgaceae bacterium BMA10]